MLIAVFAIIGCEKNEVIDQVNPYHTITASIDALGTKTTMDHNTVLWEADDAISVFFSNGQTIENVKYTVKSESAGKPTAEFEVSGISLSPGTTPVAALYPYDEQQVFQMISLLHQLLILLIGQKEQTIKLQWPYYYREQII